MIPDIITTQHVAAKRAAQKKIDKSVSKEVEKATVNADMPATPSQQIMSGVVSQQQRQAALQKKNKKAVVNKLKELYNVPADILASNRLQQAIQQEQIKKQVQQSIKEQEYSAIAPKEMVQDSSQELYIDEKRLAMLEKIYNGLPPKKKFNFQQLIAHGQFVLPLQNYPGGFVNPNYDKQTRPLGNDTSKVTEF